MDLGPSGGGNSSHDIISAVMDGQFVWSSVSSSSRLVISCWKSCAILSYCLKPTFLSGTITESLKFSFTVSFFPFVYLTIQRFFLFSVTFHLTILSGWMRLVITESIRDRYIRHSLGTTASLLLYSRTSEDAGPSPVLWHHSRRHHQCLDQPSGTQGRGGNATTSESQENLGAKSIPYFFSLSFDSQHFPVVFLEMFRFWSLSANTLILSLNAAFSCDFSSLR